MTLLIRESYVNSTQHVRFGDSDWFEPGPQDRGALFKSLQREYGRCTSAMYVDKTTGEVQKIGWVFEKRMRYEDARRDPDTGRFPESSYYTREVWVELRDTPLCARCNKDESAHHAFTVQEADS